MATWFIDTLRRHPEMALLLTLALGYAIGKIKLGGIALGAVVGVLIAGVLVGQVGIQLSADIKTVFFLLFLFAIGYRTGPQFFSGIRASGLPQVALTVLTCGTALGVGTLLSKAFGFDAGTAAGLLGGGMTESATVGTGTDAIGRLPVDAAEKQRLLSNVAVAFAVTYFLGVVTTMTYLARVAPKLLRIDLVAECRILENQMGLASAEQTTAYRTFAARVHRLDNDSWAGKTVAEIERALAIEGHRIFVPRVRQAGQVLEAQPGLVVRRGDAIVLAGRRAWVVTDVAQFGPEIDDRELLDFPVDSVEVIVTSKAIAGHTIAELAVRHLGGPIGVGLRRITRGGIELPWTMKTTIARGDILTLVGRVEDVARATRELGYADRPTHMTSMVGVATAIFVGGMIGIPAVVVGGLEIGLSQSVGVLLGGLVLGWLRSVDRRFGGVPEGALWIFDSMGLAVFLAATALSAGPEFVKGLQTSGLRLVIAGLVLVIVPLTVTLLVGRYVFRMHPGILLGVCCGACTSAPSLAAVQEVAQSKIPTLGYGVTYAVGNVLLALWGTVIVALMHAP